MTELYQPAHVVEPPQALICARDPRISLNPRARNWPDSIVASFRTNHPRRNMYHAMFPPFADFLSKLSPGTGVIISCQDTAGGIVTITDAIEEIILTGDEVTIWLKHEHKLGAPSGCIWGNFALAIAKLSRPIEPNSRRDVDGTHFINVLNNHFRTP